MAPSPQDGSSTARLTVPVRSWIRSATRFHHHAPSRTSAPCTNRISTIFVFSPCSRADLLGGVVSLHSIDCSNASESPSIRFFSTSRIESLDHKLIATIRQTTSCADNDRWRSSSTLVLAITCSIASVGMAVSIALNISVACILGDTSENSLRCNIFYCHSW